MYIKLLLWFFLIENLFKLGFCIRYERYNLHFHYLISDIKCLNKTKLYFDSLDEIKLYSGINFDGYLTQNDFDYSNINNFFDILDDVIKGLYPEEYCFFTLGQKVFSSKIYLKYKKDSYIRSFYKYVFNDIYKILDFKNYSKKQFMLNNLNYDDIEDTCIFDFLVEKPLLSKKQKLKNKIEYTLIKLSNLQKPKIKKRIKYFAKNINLNSKNKIKEFLNSIKFVSNNFKNKKNN